jgi:hypothetical protein
LSCGINNVGQQTGSINIDLTPLNNIPPGVLKAKPAVLQLYGVRAQPPAGETGFTTISGSLFSWAFGGTFMITLKYVDDNGDPKTVVRIIHVGRFT